MNLSFGLPAQRTVPVKNNSLTMQAVIRGIERYGDGFRYRYQGSWYKVLDAKKGGVGETLLVLESVI